MAVENINKLNLDNNLSGFLKRNTGQKLYVQAAKMFLLLEYIGVNFEEFENIGFEYLLRYSVFDVKQDGINPQTLADIKFRYSSFCAIFQHYLNNYRLVASVVYGNSFLTESAKEEIIQMYPFENELCLKGCLETDAREEIRNYLMYREANL